MPHNKYSENLDKAYDARKERRKNQRKLYNKFNRKELKSKELLRKYGIDADQYDRMVENQNNKCKICGTDEPRGIGGWKVDHCHSTGKVRGLLCNNCNLGLGYFKDNIKSLEAAIQYLIHSQEDPNAL